MSKFSLLKLLCFVIVVLFQSCSSNKNKNPHLTLDQLIDRMPSDTTITINTYDESNQVVHPDILFSNDTFFLAITPYPLGDDKFENPCMYWSYDGMSFTDYVTNPLVNKPKYDHNCDPDLFYDNENKKCIYYLETMRPDSNNIMLLREDSPKKFSKHRILNYKLDSIGAPLLLSPCVVKKDSTYFMYYVNCYTGINFFIEYLSTNTLHHWKKEQSKKINIDFPKDYTPWHVDVIKDKDENSFYLIVCGFHGKITDRNYSIILAKSTDMQDWKVQDEVITRKNTPDKNLKFLYRSTGIISNKKLVIWYSYTTQDATWHLALKKINLK